MKRIVVVAASMSVFALFCCGSYIAMGQQPRPGPQQALTEPLPPSAVSPPSPSPATTPLEASLAELVQTLKAVRQQKADIRREEARITEAIRRKMEEEKK